MKLKVPVLLACLALALTAQGVLAETEKSTAGCRMTVESIAFAVQPLSRELPKPSGLEDNLTPAPLFKTLVGDCCPGGLVANCPNVEGWPTKRCGLPQCETGQPSCLYSR